MGAEQVLRVLVVDDDEEDFLIVREMFREIKNTRYDLTWRGDFASALTALSAADQDVCLIDYQLRGHNGLEILAAARLMDCEIPLIMLTGIGDPELDAAALAAGATDYLVKGSFGSALLARALRYAIERKRSERELRRVAQVLEAKNEELVVMHRELTRRNAELSTPILPISERVILIPVLGVMDHLITARLLDTMLTGIVARGAQVVILDFTGVTALHATGHDALGRLASATKLVGARLVVTGVRPAVASVLVQLESTTSGVAFSSTLMAGITLATGRR
jgi:CheY-like chemotaxis protein/anti-anti-sigma regulatory factor